MTSSLNVKIPPPSPSRLLEPASPNLLISGTEAVSPTKTLRKRRQSTLEAMNLSSSTASLSDSSTNVKHRRKSSVIPSNVKIGLYSHPWTTLKYFVLYLMDNLQVGWQFLAQHFGWVAFFVGLILMGIYAYNAPGPHQTLVQRIESGFLWYGYWLILGIMSSIGLGTGLHTFVLFLGPFIAQVTTVAYFCGHLDFYTRGPDSFVCKSSGKSPTMLRIANKVKWEAFCWGLGTALGELPPYFVARAASLAGKHDEEVEELEDIEELEKADPRSLPLMDRVKVTMMHLLQRYGFVGILLCASIPNPLFDVAGIVCGHFLIPFYTFFGATFLGKAVFKTSIQSLFIIALFSQESLDLILFYLQKHTPRLHQVVQGVLAEQLKRYQTTNHVEETNSWFGVAWNGILISMLLYFLLSIVESLAVSQYRKEKRSAD